MAGPFATGPLPVRPASLRLGLLILASALAHAAIVSGLDRLMAGTPAPSAARLSAVLLPAPQPSASSSPVSPPSPPLPARPSPAEPRETSPVSLPTPAPPLASEPPPVPPSELARDSVVELLPGPRYYAANELDQRPVAITPILPEYPETASPDGAYLVVRILIDEHGRTERVVVLIADPENEFEQAVAEAFSRGRFRPGMKNGVAVKSQIVAEIRFFPEDRPGARTLAPPAPVAD